MALMGAEIHFDKDKCLVRNKAKNLLLEVYCVTSCTPVPLLYLKLLKFKRVLNLKFKRMLNLQIKRMLHPYLCRM